MTPDDVESFIDALRVGRRPGLTFKRFATGSSAVPWSVADGPYTWKFPSEELWDNCEYAKRLKWRLPADCRRVFGLGSLYTYVSCSTGEVLYVGRAGETPAQNRIFDELKRSVGRPLTFPDNCWRDKTTGPNQGTLVDAKQTITGGRFYVVFFINDASWGTFSDPYADAAAPNSNPFLEISADLEAWVMQKGGIPPLNTRDERRRVIDANLPWGMRGT